MQSIATSPPGLLYIMVWWRCKPEASVAPEAECVNAHGANRDSDLQLERLGSLPFTEERHQI